MAKVQVTAKVVKSTVTRKGIHSKTKQSKNQNSKHYDKPYRGQGR